MKIFKQIVFFLISIVLIGYAWTYFNGKFEFFCTNSQGSEYYQIYGVLGDYVGGILGTIIGFITLILVYLTYTSQKDELKLQSQLIAQQQFESTFFNMLNVHRELKNSLELNIIKRICRINTSKETTEFKEIKKEYYNDFTNKIDVSDYKGIDVFKLIKLDFESLYESFKELKDNDSAVDGVLNIHIRSNLFKNRSVSKKGSERNIVITVYWELFENYKDIISHYCRNVYHILKFIRESEKQNVNSYRNYADIFQSQLNIDEQFLLFYNFIVFDDNSNLDKDLHPKNIVNHYEFLENLGYKNLLEDSHNYNNFYNFNIK
jgi:hypothetical protein